MIILSINWTNAFIVTALGLLVVFIVLCLLIVVLDIFGIIIQKLVKNENAINRNNEQYPKKGLSGTESAAIAMALHDYFMDVHDEESGVVTIKNSSQKYSPWNTRTP